MGKTPSIETVHFCAGKDQESYRSKEVKLELDEENVTMAENRGMYKNIKVIPLANTDLRFQRSI